MVYKLTSSLCSSLRPAVTRFLNTAADAALDSILPPICLICGQSALSTSRLCSHCQPHITLNSDTEKNVTKLRCLRCSVEIAPSSSARIDSSPQDKVIRNNKISNDGALFCAQCIKHPPLFDQCVSALDYAAIPAKLINQLKHQGKLAATVPISHSMTLAVQSHYQDLSARIDLAVAVPLHTDRLRQRGFNQAYEIAKPVCKQLDIPLAINLCQRQFDNTPQQLADRATRQRNLRGAFIVNKRPNKTMAANIISRAKNLSGKNLKPAFKHSAKPISRHKIEGKQIAIIDDVVTTGATANALAKSLLAAGASRCDIWCFARTPRK